MPAGNEIILYIGILLILSIEQIFTTSQCDITKGDCVADDKRGTYYCESTCFRTPDSCKGYGRVDLFGKSQNYQCNCKHLSDCQFQILSKCENGCLPGYEKPYCQKRKYHEFIKNESNTYSYLFSSDNKQAKKPRIVIYFGNTYRFSTVEIYSNFSDSTMNVTYPPGMECKLKPKINNTMCTGNVESNQLYIDGNAGVYRIKLLGCPPQLYGRKCTNECHCSGGESCHQITGKCKDGCEDGWYGEKCENQTYVNIALGKQTYQSSTYGTKGTRVFVDNGTCMDRKVEMASDKAVDGNFDPGVVHKSCTFTNWEKNPFWKVTFDKSYMISQLRIYNRMGNRDRLKGFKVYVGSSLCFESRGYEYDKDVIHIKCGKPLNSSYVKISFGDGWNKKMLTLCEVEVLQCVPGFYGDMCKERCDTCVDSKCDQVTGRCEEGCIKGYYWSDRYKKCKECLSGKFGRDCTKSCHCSLTCNHINGSCPGVCHAGYTGYNCQEECEVGRFGSNCKSTCHCIDNKNCDRITGRCSDGCSEGYKGYNCQQKCSSGKFGRNCTKSCHCSRTCNHINGSCPGVCDAGYTGYNCQEECEVSRFGSNCKSTCHCIDDEKCDRKTGECSVRCSAGYKCYYCQEKCPDGTFGQNCKESCHCSLPCHHVNGSCPGECDRGYTGFNCQEECEVGRFGRNCKGKCHCIDNRSCNKVNGSCRDGCSAGYIGFDCQEECLSGKFGLNCTKSCHCSLTCNHINGSCPGVCDAGYTGYNCQEECEVGRFGSNCRETCHCIDNKNCDRKTGECSDGCSDGYKGCNCQRSMI